MWANLQVRRSLWSLSRCLHPRCSLCKVLTPLTVNDQLPLQRLARRPKKCWWALHTTRAHSSSKAKPKQTLTPPILAASACHTNTLSLQNEGSHIRRSHKAAWLHAVYFGAGCFNMRPACSEKKTKKTTHSSSSFWQGFLLEVSGLLQKVLRLVFAGTLSLPRRYMLKTQADVWFQLKGSPWSELMERRKTTQHKLWTCVSECLHVCVCVASWSGCQLRLPEQDSSACLAEGSLEASPAGAAENSWQSPETLASM